MVAITLDLSWCTVELLSLKPLTARAVQDCWGGVSVHNNHSGLGLGWKL